MAKKNFKSGLDDLFKENLHEINNANQNNNEQSENKQVTISGINIEDIDDEKLKWLIIRLQRYEKELKLWRTGKLTQKKFAESLKEYGLIYDPDTNEFFKK